MKAKIKEAILETAWKMMERYGIHKTNINDVAHAAMVAKATIYNYFGSKDQVYKEALDRKIGLMIERINSGVSILDSPLEKLKVFIKMSMETVMEEKFLFAETYNPSQRFVSKINAAREHFFLVQERLLEKILEQGAIEGFFQAQNIAKAVKLIGYLLRGFSPSGNDKKAAVSNQLDLNMEATSLYDILCNGLLSNKENLKPCNSKS
jgi:AcrR family transcriptional regulator